VLFTLEILIPHKIKTLSKMTNGNLRKISTFGKQFKLYWENQKELWQNKIPDIFIKVKINRIWNFDREFLQLQGCPHLYQTFLSCKPVC
jgi:hypothetical protein